jgi:hypothetical protein
MFWPSDPEEIKRYTEQHSKENRLFLKKTFLAQVTLSGHNGCFAHTVCDLTFLENQQFQQELRFFCLYRERKAPPAATGRPCQK